MCRPRRIKDRSEPRPAIAAERGEWDPYVLVLLAEQAIQADQGYQARCLIEAAYAAYDRS